jgi:hypothetical protein
MFKYIAWGVGRLTPPVDPENSDFDPNKKKLFSLNGQTDTFTVSFINIYDSMKCFNSIKVI